MGLDGDRANGARCDTRVELHTRHFKLDRPPHWIVYSRGEGELGHPSATCQRHFQGGRWGVVKVNDQSIPNSLPRSLLSQLCPFFSPEKKKAGAAEKLIFGGRGHSFWQLGGAKISTHYDYPTVNMPVQMTMTPEDQEVIPFFYSPYTLLVSQILQTGCLEARIPQI
jgi:hypothetical protein